METPKAPPEVPRQTDLSVSEGSGLTPHSLDQLTMSSDRTRGGFRLLYPSAEPSASGHATLCYVVDHCRKGGYDMTVITPTLSDRKTHDDFQTDIVPRSQGIDPPAEWAEAAWEAWLAGRVSAVQRVLRSLTKRPEEAQTPATAEVSHD